MALRKSGLEMVLIPGAGLNCRFLSAAEDTTLQEMRQELVDNVPKRIKKSILKRTLDTIRLGTRLVELQNAGRKTWNKLVKDIEKHLSSFKRSKQIMVVLYVLKGMCAA